MDLPHVSLDPVAVPCPPRRLAAVSLRADGPGDGRTDSPGDGKHDGPGDGKADGPGDGRRDAGAAAEGPVLMFSPVAPSGGEPASPGLPGVVLGPRRPPAARVLGTLAHWADRWWQAALRAVANPRGPYYARPESLAAHDEYRRSRAWVPPGQEGRFLGPLGGAYHHTAGRAGLATGYLWAWIWARPLRLFIAVVITGGIFLGFWLG